MHRILIAACLSVTLPACELGCQSLSESSHAPEAGLNGGFEVVRDGLPAEWDVYTPATVPGAEFVLALDEEVRREGLHALRFDVAACGDEGGWLSPGLARELPVEPGATYVVSFQVRSEGARWTADVGGVGAKTGELEQLEASSADEGQWTRVEHRVVVPEHYERLRIQFNVRSPGTVWLDDVRVERAGA